MELPLSGGYLMSALLAGSRPPTLIELHVDLHGSQPCWAAQHNGDAERELWWF